MSKYAFIDNIFGPDESEENEANDAFDEDDEVQEESDDESEESDEDDGSDEDELPEEDDAMLARLDKEYRKLRARVRGLTDLSALRAIRLEQAAALAGRLTPTVRLRTLDIIEAIDDQVTSLRASRGPRGS